jgi:hypothetical protein
MNVTPDTFRSTYPPRTTVLTPGGARLAPRVPRSFVPQTLFADDSDEEDVGDFFQNILVDESNKKTRAKRARDIDLSGFTTDQLHSLTPYGSMLGLMSAGQIEGLLSKTTGSTPDGRALFASRPAPKRNFLDPQRNFVQSPGGDRLYY